MVQQGSGAGGEDEHSVLDRLETIVEPVCPVAAGISADSLERHLRRARQVRHQPNVSQAGYVMGLPDLPGQTIEDNEIIRAHTSPGDEGTQNGLGNVEVLVFQHRARLEDKADEVDIVRDKLLYAAVARGGTAKLLAEIEVKTLAVPEAAFFQDLAQRCLARARRADQ